MKCSDLLRQILVIENREHSCNWFTAALCGKVHNSNAYDYSVISQTASIIKSKIEGARQGGVRETGSRPCLLHQGGA